MTADTPQPLKTLALTCSQCKITAPLPKDRNYSRLWDIGWRWIGSHDLYSCPACPPVIVVTSQGRHHRGPGTNPRV